MGLKYSKSFTVPYYLIDSLSEMTIPALLGVALAASGEQSIGLSRSDEWLAETYGLTWIVSEYEIELVRLPRFKEEITIETEAVSYNKLFCYRDFHVKDREGKELVKIHSTWVLMQLETRKVAWVIEDIVYPYQSEMIKTIGRGHSFKLFKPEAERQYRVRFLDIDSNQHVNNTKYYEWALDMLPLDFIKSHQPTHIYIKYNREILYGTEVTSAISLEGLVSHHSVQDGACQVEIVWKDRNY